MKPKGDQCPLPGTRYPVFYLFLSQAPWHENGCQRGGLQLGPGTSIIPTPLCTEFQVPTGPPGVVKMECRKRSCSSVHSSGYFEESTGRGAPRLISAQLPGSRLFHQLLVRVPPGCTNSRNTSG